jgi:AraC family ethanolamine operon transcriptional activator
MRETREKRYFLLSRCCLSPLAYFKASRLNAVRQELKAGYAGTTTVREIAQRWGFRHTGEFAADYRRLFGELPSETFNR